MHTYEARTETLVSLRLPRLRTQDSEPPPNEPRMSRASQRRTRCGRRPSAARVTLAARRRLPNWPGAGRRGRRSGRRLHTLVRAGRRRPSRTSTTQHPIHHRWTTERSNVLPANSPTSFKRRTISAQNGGDRSHVVREQGRNCCRTTHPRRNTCFREGRYGTENSMLSTRYERATQLLRSVELHALLNP